MEEEIVKSDLIQAIGALINAGWTMLSEITFPGTGITINYILIGAFIAFFGIRIFAYTMRMSVNTGGLIGDAQKMRRNEKTGKKK